MSVDLKAGIVRVIRSDGKIIATCAYGGEEHPPGQWGYQRISRRRQDCWRVKE